MATRKKKTNGKKTTALTNWDAEFAEAAEESAGQEAGTGGGSFFSIRNGQLSFAGSEIPGSSMCGVVLDSVHENVYYAGSYDPDSPSGPACFAFGRSDPDMKPHENASEVQSAMCDGCENNEFGSAAVGRGKACRNRRRLAIVSAGDLDRSGAFTPNESADGVSKGEVGFLAVPPTAINGWGAYVKSVKALYNRPPWAVITRITVEPDPKKQIKLTFECEGPIPSDWNAAAKARHLEVKELIEFPYASFSDSDEKPKGKGAKSKARGTTKRAPRSSRF